MNREEILKAVQQRVKNPNLVNHMLATEAVLRALARRLGQDEQEWGLAGLVHDIDVELTQAEPARHSRLSAELALALGLSPGVAQAVLCHNEAHGIPRQSLLDKALFCADPMTGLIVAAALVRPERKLAGLTVDSVLRRFREKRFAAGASREQISQCQELGLGLEEFFSLGLEAMQGIAPQLGLSG